MVAVAATQMPWSNAVCVCTVYVCPGCTHVHNWQRRCYDMFLTVCQTDLVESIDPTFMSPSTRLMT